MSAAPLTALIARCRALCRPCPPVTDAELVRRFAGKCKLLLAALLLATAAAGVIGQARPPETGAKPAAELKKSAPRARTDRHGDPLPDGAVARLGTVRWRHGFYVHALQYSPDGKKIAAVGRGRGLTLWDAATGKEVRQFPHSGAPFEVTFSPNGKVLASADLRICHLWDAATGEELRQLKGHTKRVSGLVFAPDGKTLATVSHDETARLWDARDGKELRRLDCKQGELNAVAYSPDGKSLATAGHDGTIRLWDAATGRAGRHLKGHQKAVWKLVFSPDGTRLASSGADRTIRLWDAATARPLRVLGEQLSEYNLPIAFSPDGTVLAAGTGHGVLRLWDAANGAQKRQWQAGAMDVRALAFSPGGKTLASGAAWEGTRLWDAATGGERHPPQEHLGVVEFVRFSPDGRSLVSISREHRLVCWDLATQTPRRQFTWTGGGISRTALSPDGDTLAVGTWSDAEPSAVRLWDLRTGKPGRRLGEPQLRFGALAFSPDGRLAASWGSDRAIHIWDVRGVEVRRMSGVANGLGRLCFCFSPDSKALACGTDPLGQIGGAPTLRLWDVGSGKERCSFALHSAVESLAFSPDGKVLASGDGSEGDGSEALVHLWDTTTGKELGRHKGPGSSSIGAVAFSPDGKLIASGGKGEQDCSVHLWEAATGRLIRHFEGHHNWVWSVAFASDGLTIASGGGDSTILLWDITGRRADGRFHVKPLTPRELEACWTALGDEDAGKAYDAVWTLVAAPEQAVPFLRKHLPPTPRPNETRIARRIADLDSDDFKVRQQAAEELRQFGDAISPILKRALGGKPSLEVRRRLQHLLDQSSDWTPDRLRDHRAIQGLEHLGTRPAREVLHALAGGAPEAHRTEEAKRALQRLAR